MHTSGSQFNNRCNARRNNHVATRTMRSTDSGCAQSLNLIVIRHDTMRHPCAITQPAHVSQILERATTKHPQRKVIIFDVFCEMCMKTNIKFFSKFCRPNHQGFCDTKRRTRRKRNAHHCAMTAIVMPLNRSLRLSQDLIIILDHIVGWQSAIFL